LGLDVDLTDFYAMAAANPPLDELAQRFRGMRPPRFPSLFEALINGVACQQVSMQAGLTLLNRLVAAFGQAEDPATSGQRAFPTPEDLAAADVRAVQAAGLSLAKSVAIKEIAVAAARGEIECEALADLDDDAARARLDKLRGVGRWTAEYVLLRGCGRMNVFPGDDVGARNNLRGWLKSNGALDYEGVRTLLRRWRPYAGLVYFHLLLKSLDEQGMLTPTTA
jgi:DNA-3-methyladenine glycosylase II